MDYWGQERKYAYTAAGHLRESIDPLGQLISYKTDPLGRIVEKLLPDSAKPETFSYDANGNLIACENSSVRVEWDYDLDGRMLEERQGSECVVSNAYNLNGVRIARATQINEGKQTQSHTINYNYDVLGRATTVEVPGHAPLQFTRNALGQITREVLSSSLKRIFDYSPDGYLIAQKVLNAEGPVFEQQYIYDRSGNMTRKKDSAFGIDQFSYDPLGQIISHTNPEGQVKRYLNDPAGDLLSTKVVDSETAWNREGEFKGMFYRYDRAGNLSERSGSNGQTKFVWDANQRLVESTTDGRTTVYCCDPLGRRISKETDGVVTRFFWDGDALLGDATLEQSGYPRQREWIYYPGSFKPLAMIQVQDIYLYHNDPNGCPTRLLDPNGKVVWAARYDALGKVESLPVNQVDNPLRMQGQYFDEETGLYYNRYRYFDPTICAFISQDPLGLAAGENVYAYAPNVWGWVDPLGLKKKKCAGVGKAAATRPTKTLNEWLEDSPDLLDETRQWYNEKPNWWGINPDETPVFYRPKADVDAIRKLPGESGGHHPHGLGLGGPEGQTLTPTGETARIKNPTHSQVTGLQKRVINKIKGQTER